MSPDLIRKTILQLTAARGAGKTICPSEVARHLQPGHWRPLMPPVRAAADELRRSGKIRITQGDEDVDPAEVRGPIRLSAIQAQ